MKRAPEHSKSRELAVPTKQAMLVQPDGFVADDAGPSAASAISCAAMSHRSFRVVDRPSDPGEAGPIGRTPVSRWPVHPTGTNTTALCTGRTGTNESRAHERNDADRQPGPVMTPQGTLVRHTSHRLSSPWRRGARWWASCRRGLRNCTLVLRSGGEVLRRSATTKRDGSPTSVEVKRDKGLSPRDEGRG